MAKPKRQTEREIRRAIARSGRSARLLTARTRIIIESDGDRDECSWGDFASSNQEMPELPDVADQLRRLGHATIGGGAAPLTVVRISEASRR